MSELIDIIISAIDEATSTFESITGSAEDMETSVESTGGSIQDVIDYCNSLDGSGMRDVATAADEVEQETLEADNAVQQLDTDLGIINTSMIMQLGEQVGALGGKAEGMAQDMNTAAISVGQLATQTGIAEPQMVSLINNISNATFPNDEAMLYVKSLDQMGVSADNLGKSATDLDRINDAFGLGAQTTNHLGQELSVLGVDANNLSSSFNALAYANDNTVGGMDNYFRFLQRYDATFKELGFDVDQTSVIIAAATKKYGGGRAAISGLNEALKESDGDVRALEKSLGLETGTLDNASQLTGEYAGTVEELASQEKEHKTILDQVGAAWEDISLSIGSVASPLMGVVGLFGQMGSFGLQVKGIKELLTTFKGLKTAVMEFTVVEKLAGVATAAYGTIVGVVTGEIGLAEAATMAWNAVLAINPIFLVIIALVALAVAIYEVGKAFGWWTDVSSMLDAIWAGLMNIYNTIMSNATVQGVIKALGDAFNWVVSCVNNAINIFNQFRTGQMDLPTFIMTVLTNLANAYNTIFTTIGRLVVKFGKMLLQRAKSAGRGFVNGVVNWIKQLPGRIYTQLIQVVRRIISAGQQWISTAKEKARGIIDAVYNTLTGLPGRIGSALSGVANAITKPFRDAYDGVAKQVDKIKRKAEELLHIDLPMGGEVAPAGGETGLIGNISPGQYMVNGNNNPIVIEDNIYLTLDLKNVPVGVDTNTLINALTDKNVVSALANNRDFQSMDAQVKQKLNLKQLRSGGI